GRTWAVGLVSLALVLTATVLPHVVGGPNFAIFQANRHDAINYLSKAVSYGRYTYAELLAFRRDPPAPIAPVLFGAEELEARPAVSILYAGIYKLLGGGLLRHAYDYCVALQLNLYFSVVAMMLALFPHRPIAGHVVSVAFATGFFGQYLLDINAWSELLAVP